MAARSGPALTADLRLLGAVEARSSDGAMLDVGPAKCQVVLATLALSVGSPVPVPRLVEAVWGLDQPRTAQRTLQSYLARLRGALGADTIERTSGAYRLMLPADAVDVSRFERCLDRGDVEGALAEWTGDPLAGLESPGLQSARVGLTERWLTAVEQDLEVRVESDPAASIGRLSALTAAHPFREGLWALLMTVLYRVGRQADALAAYQTAHDRLAESLGVVPGRRLQDLQLRILRHDPELGTDLSVTSQNEEAILPSGTVTFGFVDVEDAAAHWSRDAAAMAEAMAGHHARVHDLSGSHAGHVFTHVGDTYGVAFDSAEQAAAWASTLQASRIGAVADRDLRLRLGLHTGAAEAIAGTYFGPAVHVSSRLATVGHGGQTLVSEATAGLVDRPLRDLGRWALADVPTELRVLQLGPGEYPPLRTEDRRRGNLPRRLHRLVGRDDELARIRTALGSHQLVSLVGPGGIGKTRLALAAAHQQAPTTGWLVELASITSAADVPRAVAEALGVTERPGVDLTQGIVDRLQPSTALLVLDNCEHVVDDAARLAARILTGCPNTHVLATSRERLGLTDERLITVPPLGAEPSVTLFAERARALDPTFDADANRAVVEDICQRVDGIPLAIELAAARTGSLGLDDLRERLRHRMRVLDGTRRSGDERHRTLWSAIQWSYDLLMPHERDVFRRLSVFSGPFDLAAAEWVAGSACDSDVANAVGRLAEQSLVTVESGPFGRRFRLLEPLREFGRERLAEAGTTEIVAERHARWCWCEVTAVHAMLAGWGEHEGVARLTELWPNLRSAFDWACRSGHRELACNLLVPVLSEIVVRSATELGDWAEHLLSVTPPQDEEARVLALYAAAHRYSMTQDPASYDQLVERYGEPDHVLMHHARAIATQDHTLMATWAPLAVAEFRERGDTHLAERAEINIAGAWLNLGELDRADARLETLIARYREQGPPTFLSWTLLLLGYSALFAEDKERAYRCFAEGVEIEVPPRTHTPSQPLRARAAFRRGDHTRAFGILRDHIDELLLTDNMQAGMMDCIEFITMMAATDRPREAVAGAPAPRGGPPARHARLAPARRRAGRGTGRSGSGRRYHRRPHRPAVHAQRARPPRRWLNHALVAGLVVVNVSTVSTLRTRPGPPQPRSRTTRPARG
jgi:predicted ATPase/DNA-binding SARP family transcriptional activator